MTDGVLYIASGEKYISEAKKSEESVKKQMPDIKSALVTDDDVDDDSFDHIIDLPKSYPHSGISTITPGLSPFDRTLFLDTDTFITTPVYELFEILESHEIAFTLSPGRLSVPGLPEPWIEFNTGVIAYNQSSTTEQFFEKWQKEYEKMLNQSEIERNQPSFTRAIHDYDPDYFVLPREYNCRVPRYGYLAHDAKIIHGRCHEPIDEIAKTLNETSDRRVHWPTLTWGLKQGIEVKSNTRSYKIKKSVLNMMDLTQEANRICKQEGFASLFHSATQFLKRNMPKNTTIKKVNDRLGKVYKNNIRSRLPVTGMRRRRDIVVGKKRIFDEYLPNQAWTGELNDKPDYKQGTVKLLKDYVNQGDGIVVVGGGYGVTAVQALREAGNEGQAHIYEGSKKQINILEEVMKNKNMSDVSYLNHAIVGEDLGVYDELGDPKIVAPNNLPECDVLELDCEGAEVNILKNLQIKPRVIIVEVHPHKFEESPNAAVKCLEELGYEIDDVTDQNGNSVSRPELQEMLNFDRSSTNRKLTESGKVHPPVLAAVRK